MSEPTTSEPTLSLRKRIVFSGILLLLVLGAFEAMGQLYLRAVRGYDGGPFLQYQFDPYKNIHLSNSWVDTRGVTHNAQGFREVEDVPLAAPPGTFRVFLMGASTAYGLGGMFPHIQNDYAVLDNSETIDAYLEEFLEESLTYDAVEVINVGIPSIWTHHHLIYLNQTILRYEPDLILFLDGWNDHFFVDRSHDQFSAFAQNEQAQGIMGPPTLGSLIRMNSWWLFRRSAAAHVMARAGRDLLTAIRAGDPPPPINVDEALQNLEYVFERNALRMIERNAVLLEHEGIPAIFLLQPMLILERDHLGRMPPIERDLFEFNVGWQQNYEEFMHGATPIVSEKVEAAVTRHGHRYMDLTGIYDDSEGQIFTDYAHLTPEGNRILAAEVAREITDLVMSPPEADSTSGPSDR